MMVNPLTLKKKKKFNTNPHLFMCIYSGWAEVASLWKAAYNYKGRNPSLPSASDLDENLWCLWEEDEVWPDLQGCGESKLQRSSHDFKTDWEGMISRHIFISWMYPYR